MSDSKKPHPKEENERDDHRDLDDLGEKLREVQESRKTKKGIDRSHDEMPNNGLGIGLRIGTELLVGVMVGLAIGWFIDRQFGTEPWGLLIFFVLGFSAGILNVVRVANQATTIGVKEADPSDKTQD